MKLPKFDWKKFKGSFRTRSFRAGGYSVAAAVIVLAIAIAANVFVNALPASITQFDITSNQLFTISEQTEQILNGLEDEVTVYWVVQDGKENATLEMLLDRYEALSSKIKVVKKDPDVYPTFVEQYVSGSYYNNSLIVECGTRSRFVSYEDIYEYDYSDYYYTGEYTERFAGESALTSAISYVTNESLPKLYTLTGHGEITLPSSFQTAVQKENMDLETLSLLTVDEIPEDADCILICAPQSDLSEAEKDMLLAYVRGGGNLLALTDPLEDGTRLANLEALMAEYGVSTAEGVVIEGDRNYYALGAPYYLLPSVNSSHTITSPLSESGYYVLLSVAQGLTVSDTLPEGVSVTKLLTTSDSAFSKLAGYGLTTYEKETGDIDGPFALAVAVTQTLEDGEGHIVWVSSSSLLDETVNTQISGGNLDFFLNALGWMCEHEDSISIHSKSLDYEPLTMSSGTASALTVLVVAVIPLVYLGIGIYTWIRRKRR